MKFAYELVLSFLVFCDRAILRTAQRFSNGFWLASSGKISRRKGCFFLAKFFLVLWALWCTYFLTAKFGKDAETFLAFLWWFISVTSIMAVWWVIHIRILRDETRAREYFRVAKENPKRHDFFSRISFLFCALVAAGIVGFIALRKPAIIEEFWPGIVSFLFLIPAYYFTYCNEYGGRRTDTEVSSDVK